MNNIDLFGSTDFLFFNILDEFKIVFWLDSGSLLKGVRDGSILFSSDVDISITSSSITDLILALNKLNHVGFICKFNGGYPMFEDLVTVYLPQPVNNIYHIDIFVYFRFKNLHFVRFFLLNFLGYQVMKILF